MKIGTRGDTLIEVTIALAILASVLISTTHLSIVAFEVGQMAQDRTAISNVAQQQIESLRSFRDNNTWSTFLTGGQSGSSTFGGVLNSNGSHCHGVSSCFHMTTASLAGGATAYVPLGGGASALIPTSYVTITATPVPTTNPTVVQFTVYYGSLSPTSGPAIVGEIQTELADLSAPPALPPGRGPAPAGGALFNSPGSSGSGGHEVNYGKSVINQSPIAPADVASCSWSWGDGTTTTGVACIPGQEIKHAYPPGVKAAYTITLTERATDGAVGYYTKVSHIPSLDDCTPGPSNPGCTPG